MKGRRGRKCTSTVEEQVQNGIPALSDTCYSQYLPIKGDQIHNVKVVAKYCSQAAPAFFVSKRLVHSN